MDPLSRNFLFTKFFIVNLQRIQADLFIVQSGYIGFKPENELINETSYTTFGLSFSFSLFHWNYRP